jgi:hypothetical protein
MKYIDGLFVNEIIQYFEQIAIAVKTMPVLTSAPRQNYVSFW